MRDYLEELLAGTEDALDQAEAEWTEGVSLPCPADPGSGRRRRAARRSRREAPGPKRRPGVGKTGLKQSWRGSLDPERQGRFWSPGSGRNSRKVRQGLRAVLSDRPLEGMRRPPCPGCCGPDGRGVPSLGSGVWGDPRRGPGLCRRSGEERASLWETEGVAGTRRLQAAMELARRAAGYRREPRADRAGPVSLRPGSDEPLLREHDSARTVDRIFRRDARRYDGGFALF